MQRDGGGDADTLPLSAGKLMWVAVERDVAQADAIKLGAGLK